MNLKDYRRGRSDGLALAYRVYKEGGIEALEKEIKFREKTKINTGIMLKEIEDSSEQMRGFINETQILLWLSVLHDEFDFREKGYAGWCDYLELIQEKMWSEMADVINCIIHVAMQWEKVDDVLEEIDRKLDRQIERMGNE